MDENQNTDNTVEKTEAATTPVNTEPVTSDTDCASTESTTTSQTAATQSETNSTAAATQPETNSTPVAATQPESSQYYANTSQSNATYTTTTAPEPVPKGFAIVSLVLGIGGLLTSCCCGMGSICCILSIIFGCIQQKDEYGKKPSMAVAGIIISCIGLLLSVIFLLYFVVVGMGSGNTFSTY